MTGFTDLHNHCLWGLDDGAESFEESCQMLQLAVGDGITTLAATVHVCPGVVPFDVETYLRRLEELRRWAKLQELPLTILEGSEIWYTDATLPMLRSGRIPTIGGSHYVLVEFSPKVPWKTFENALEGLFRAGYIPIIAHVERYKNLYRHTAGLLRMHREIDVCFQVNAGSVMAPRTLGQRYFLKYLFHAGAIDLVATDAHDKNTRASNLRPAYACLEKRYGWTYARALTSFHPEAHLQNLCKG